MKKNKGHIDWYVLLIVSGLMLFSIAFVYSASAAIAEARFGSADKLFWSHSFRILLAFITMFLFIKFDYHYLGKLSKILIFGSLIPLLLVFIIGTPINGAYRWLNLGFFQVQPSEFAKFALVIHFAAFLSKRQDYVDEFKFAMLPLLIWTGVICLMIAIQPNFSTSLVIFFISMAMMFVGNINRKHLLTTFVSFAGIAAIYAVSAPYRMQRLLSFIGLAKNPDDLSEVSYQIQQAIIAFGNGGLFGRGPGQSIQSHLFLPESYGDFIFSIIAEEYGFVGVTFILIAFLFLFWRGLKICKRAPDLFGFYLSFGIIFTFAIYTLISASVNCGLLPATGLPMPFISYGGTAVIIYGAAIGVLLNISSQSQIFPKTATEKETQRSEPGINIEFTNNSN